MRKLNKVVIFVAFVFLLFAGGFGQTVDIFLDNIQKKSEELNLKQDLTIQTEMRTTNTVSQAKQMIYEYYGRTNFEEPTWIRVKNFLIWLEY